jgi:hypothetical protein
MSEDSLQRDVFDLLNRLRGEDELNSLLVRLGYSFIPRNDDRIVIKTQTQESLGFVPYSLRAASTGWNWRGACRSSRLQLLDTERRSHALRCISIRHHNM